MPQQFASDNNAGMCPEALEALAAGQCRGPRVGYGGDALDRAGRATRCARCSRPTATVFFVFSGTAANALALAQLCRPYDAVIAHAVSHIERATRPARLGFFSGGATLVTADTPLGEADAGSGRALGDKRPGLPHVKAARAVADAGDRDGHGLLARRAGAAGRGGAPPWPQGAHGRRALCQCGGDARLLARRCLLARGRRRACASAASRTGWRSARPCCSSTRSLAQEFEWRVKQAGHLNSKMRLVTAPWLGLLEDDVWLRNARHANAMAQRLAERMREVDGVRLMVPVESNGVFAEMPAGVCRSGCAPRAGGSMPGARAGG